MLDGVLIQSTETA